LLGAVFIFSGVTKLPDIPGFAATIEQFQVLPQFLVKPIAVTLPFVELLLGFLLLIGFLTKYASIGLVALLLFFILAIIPNLVVGTTVDCGCFGNVIASKADMHLLLQDTFLMGLLLIIILQKEHSFSIDKIRRHVYAQHQS
jgi:uncharacterized membrane protein YphA (DoxX/SURF4 family)